MALRRFRLADADPCYAVYWQAVHHGTARFYTDEERRAWAPNETAPSQWRDRLADHVAYVSETAAGLNGFISMTRCGHLDFLYVVPEAMGTGLAQSLYDMLLQDPEIAPLPRLDVQASAFSRRFLLKQGWPDVPASTVERFGCALTVYQMQLTR